MTTPIPLLHGLVALVDDDDAGLAKHPWHAARSHEWQTWRAYRFVGQRKPSLADTVLGLPQDGLVTIHSNGDGLDCRRDNLRRVTRSEACRRKEPTSSPSS